MAAGAGAIACGVADATAVGAGVVAGATAGAGFTLSVSAIICTVLPNPPMPWAMTSA